MLVFFSLSLIYKLLKLMNTIKKYITQDKILNIYNSIGVTGIIDYYTQNHIDSILIIENGLPDEIYKVIIDLKFHESLSEIIQNLIINYKDRII